MNWEAIGAIGEIVGAIAVVITLIFLAFQVRLSTRATEESNKLERAFAIDRHAETIGTWRARVSENRELAELWVRATNNEELDDVEIIRVNNLFIELVNIQRSNYVRAHTVGEQGLAKQAVNAVAAETMRSETFNQLWEHIQPWNQLVSPEFNAEVAKLREERKRMPNTVFKSSVTIDRSTMS